VSLIDENLVTKSIAANKSSKVSLKLKFLLRKVSRFFRQKLLKTSRSSRELHLLRFVFIFCARFPFVFISALLKLIATKTVTNMTALAILDVRSSTQQQKHSRINLCKHKVTAIKELVT
jgi:hypothetical protein